MAITIKIILKRLAFIISITINVIFFYHFLYTKSGLEFIYTNEYSTQLINYITNTSVYKKLFPSIAEWLEQI